MITLIGKDIAKVGVNFIYYGPAEECMDCRFMKTCIGNLEKNRKYEIIEVRDNEQKCPIHSDEKVVPVIVERANIDVLTNSKNIFEGSTFTFEAPDCSDDCRYYDQCLPEGLIEGDKLIVLKNNGKHDGECKKGYKLTNLTLGDFNE